MSVESGVQQSWWAWMRVQESVVYTVFVIFVCVTCRVGIALHRALSLQPKPTQLFP